MSLEFGTNAIEIISARLEPDRKSVEKEALVVCTIDFLSERCLKRRVFLILIFYFYSESYHG